MISIGLSPHRNVLADPVVWLILAVIFASTTLQFFVPVTLPIFQRELGATLQQLALTQAGFYISALALATGGGWILTRLGHRRALSLTLALIAGALVVMGSAQTFFAVVAGAFCCGLGALSTVIITSAMIAEGFSVERQSLYFLQGLSGAAGSIVGPACLGWWFTSSKHFGASWRAGYYFAGFLFAVLAVWPSLDRTHMSPQESAAASEKNGGRSALKAVLRRSEIYAICLLTVIKSIPAAGMLTFAGLLYQKKFGVGPGRAALLLSASSTGILAGRSLLSWITARRPIPDMPLFVVCMGGASAAYSATIASPSYWPGVVMFGLAGFFFSGGGPAISSYCAVRFTTYASTAFALMGGLSYMGGAAGSYLIGCLGTRAGLERSMWAMPAFGVLVTLLSFAWWIRDKLQASEN